MKTLIIWTALLFCGLSTIGSMVSLSTAAAACELKNECSW
jgi:hypothetical protein